MSSEHWDRITLGGVEFPPTRVEINGLRERLRQASEAGTVVVIPEGAEVQLLPLEGHGRTAEVYQETVRCAEEEVTRALVGNAMIDAGGLEEAE
jgi:hypothetical protein